MLSELPVEIETERYKLRTLRSADVSPRYLSWFSEHAVKKFILAAKSQQSLQSLQKFVEEKWKAKDCLFFGIYTKLGDHVGNLKFEPVQAENACAVMGILIGEVEHRNKGLSREVILAGANYLKAKHGIKHIELGVEAGNLPAIKSYEKIGFKVVTAGKILSLRDSSSLVMSLDI